MTKKRVYVIGGGTVSHVRTHLALSAPAYGTTAIRIAELCRQHSDKLDVELMLTRMADRTSSLETSDDVKHAVEELTRRFDTKIVFFNPALVDYDACTVYSDEFSGGFSHNVGKLSPRLSTAAGRISMELVPAPKLISSIRKSRKDIFLVGFKASAGLSQDEQYIAGLNLLKSASCNLVLANDVKTRCNMIITPEEARYHVTTDREEALRNLVEMAYLRSHLTFTRSTVVAGDSIDWSDRRIPETLRTIVNHCIGAGAYKPFRGSTVGHFACRIDATTFITSKRKTNFNDLERVGMVLVKTDGPDSVISYGAKPSVGGQSQRIIFDQHPGYDCIVHFHCPIRPQSAVPTISQREYECGSHQCGQNTSSGLQRFGNLSAVFLKEHGPNIVFNRDIDPREVIDFIEANFDLSGKTGGYVSLTL